MKILVTGGAGFIGSNFVCHALKNGHEIINIDKLTYAGSLENLEQYRDHVHHHFYKTDICNHEFIEKLLFEHEPNIILHMAAESHVDRSIDDASIFIHTNINGTYALLNTILKYYNSLQDKKSFRFIHLSTDEVFGALGTRGRFDETMPYRPNSPYAASKASSDLLVRSYYKTYGFPSIIVNSSNNYGPKQYPEKLIPLTILNALERKTLPIYGDGNQIRDWLHVEDHVEALMCLMEDGHLGESYCIGGDNEITNIEVVRLVCGILDEKKPMKEPYSSLIQYVNDRPGHDFRYATNATKLKNHTSWAPKKSLKIGLKETVEWYLEHFSRMSSNGLARRRIGVIA